MMWSISTQMSTARLGLKAHNCNNSCWIHLKLLHTNTRVQLLFTCAQTLASVLSGGQTTESVIIYLLESVEEQTGWRTCCQDCDSAVITASFVKILVLLHNPFKAIGFSYTFCLIMQWIRHLAIYYLKFILWHLKVTDDPQIKKKLVCGDALSAASISWETTWSFIFNNFIQRAL